LIEGNSGCQKPKKQDQRIVRIDNENIISRKNDDGREYFEIYRIESGHCIEAPSIELGLELQSFLKNKSK
jgi:hypothetical protein